MKTSGGEWILAALVGGSLLARAAGRRPSACSAWQTAAAAAGTRRRRDGHAAWAWACWASASTSSKSPMPTRRGGMSGYLLPFEIISVHLLVVLIGAAYLARPKKRVAAERPA